MQNCGHGIEICRYEKENQASWDAFLGLAKNGHFFFRRAYMEYHEDRFIDFSLMLYRNGKLIALFPANVSGSTVYSHQGLTYGGVISDDSMTAELMIILFQEMKKFYENSGCDRMIYKPIPHIYHKRPAEEDLYALFLNEATLIRRDISSVMSPMKDRKYTKGKKCNLSKARKSEVKILESKDFSVFINMLGTVLQSRHNVDPVHSLDELVLLHNRFPDNIRLFMAYEKEIPVAGALLFQNEDVIHSQYLANSDRGKEIGALDLLIDLLLKDVFSDKKYFSFGISTENNGRRLNTGLITNKESFGARAVMHDFYEMKLGGETLEYRKL